MQKVRLRHVFQRLLKGRCVALAIHMNKRFIIRSAGDFFRQPPDMRGVCMAENDIGDPHPFLLWFSAIRNAI